ncbi:MAG: shikimate dehydrogenase [Betaproteobacteria bacterium]|nr:MAG: shikimate dehydrogenase [Betaproteobacteria bacterium]
MTERYAVIGHPVAHSKSPWIHARFAEATGQDLDYGRIEAPLDGFERAVDAFRAAGGRGLNVTLPFKHAAFRYCQDTSERARRAQAVNTLVFRDRVYGDNTDGAGLTRDIEANLARPLAGKTVLLMGAGGAAQGVAGALLDAGIAGLVIANRTLSKAQSLAARFPPAAASGYGELRAPFDIVINATAAGLGGESVHLPASVLGSQTLAYDMVYGRDTAFLQAARAAGAQACDGLGMLVEQAAESFFIWRGVRPQTRSVLDSLRGG